MARHERLADIALTEAEEAESATLRLARMLSAAREDGTITPDELGEIERQVEVVTKEVGDVKRAAEKTSVGELAAAAILTGGINPHLTRRMAAVGLSFEAGEAHA